MANVLDIIICTHNRESLLRECVDSIAGQLESQPGCGLLIVNNNQKSFKTETTEYLSKFHFITVIQEKRIGLSYARNSGINNSLADWVGFVDDDAIVEDHFIRNALEMISEEEYDCFGGHVQSWWKYGRPVWLAENYGDKPILRKVRGPLDDDQYNWGGNIFFDRQKILEAGSFPQNTGMMGKKIGYSAENIAQINMRKLGYRIGYDSDLRILHAIMPHKLHMSWHFKAAYSEGRDAVQVFRDQYTIRGYARSAWACIRQLTQSTYQLLTAKEYTLSAFNFDIFVPLARFIGKLRAIPNVLFSH